MKTKANLHVGFKVSMKIISLVAVLLTTSCATPKRFYEYNFDQSLGDLHSSAHKKKWAHQLDTSIKRSGLSSVRFEVREGDYRKSDEGILSSRSELFVDNPLKLGETYWQSFSLYIPKDFPIEDNRLVLVQWWSQHDPGEDIGRHPPLSIRFRKGRFWISLHTNPDKLMTEDSPEIVLYETKNLELGKWNDFIFQTKWSYLTDGFINVWLNKKQVVRYSGGVGYNDEVGPIFKFGIYRDKTKSTYSVYFDELRLGNTRSSVEIIE